MNKIFWTFSALLLSLTFTPSVASAQAAEQCREFTREIVIGGETVDAVGKACLQPDGAWRIVSSQDNADQQEVGREVVFVDEPPPRIIHKPRVSVGFGKRYGHHGGFYGHSGYYKPYGYRHHGYYKKGFGHHGFHRRGFGYY